MPDAKQTCEELIEGAKKALENHPKPDQRLVTVRAVDLLAALQQHPSPAGDRKTAPDAGS